jgi:hypothetical protein
MQIDRNRVQYENAIFWKGEKRKPDSNVTLEREVHSPKAKRAILAIDAGRRID